MIKPKLKEHLYRDMVNELIKLVLWAYEDGAESEKYSYGRMRTDVSNIVSKYIEAGE